MLSTAQEVEAAALLSPGRGLQQNEEVTAASCAKEKKQKTKANKKIRRWLSKLELLETSVSAAAADFLHITSLLPPLPSAERAACASPEWAAPTVVTWFHRI